jgi:hypothetical protein
MRYVDPVQLSNHPFKHSRPEPVARMRCSDDLCLLLDIVLRGTAKFQAENRFPADFLEIFPDLLNPSTGDLHVLRDLLCSHLLLLLPNYPAYFFRFNFISRNRNLRQTRCEIISGLQIKSQRPLME